MTTVPGGRAGRAVEALAFGLFAAWVAGFFWSPSDAEGRARFQSALFYFGVFPLLAATLLTRVRGVLRDRAIVLATLAFVGLLAVGVAFPSGSRELTAAQALRHLLATAVFVPAVAVLATPALRERLERVLLLAAAPSALASIVLLAAGRSLDGRALAPLSEDHPNRWGAALGVAAVVALARLVSRRAWPAAALATALAVVPAILLTRSRGALLATLAGALVLFLSRRDGRASRGGAAFLLAAVAAVSLAAPRALERLFSRGDAGRTFIWEELLERSSGHRLLGLGLTASDDVVFPPGSEDYPDGWTSSTAHGVFVGTVFRGGLPALAVLLVLLALAFRAGLRSAREGDPLVLALLVHAVVWGLFDGHGGVTAPSDVSWLVLWLPAALAAASGVHRTAPAPRVAPRREVPASAPGSGLRRGLLATGVLLVAVRLPDLSSPVGEPGALRQLDAASTIRAFAGSSFDLLDPAVAWLGGQGDAGFGLPLPEALAALGMRLTGGSVAGARLAFLALFVAAAFPVARLARRLVGRGVAPLSAVAFLAFPLGFAGSTALLPETAGFLLGPAAACLALRGLARRSFRHLAGATGLASLGLVVNPSFLVPWLPLLVAAALGGRRRPAALRALPLLLFPAAACFLWNGHVGRARASSPDLSFLSGAVPAAEDPRWPVAPPFWRLSFERLPGIADSVLSDVAGPALLLAVLVGGVLAFRPGRRRALLPAAGALLHLLLCSRTLPSLDVELLATLPAAALLAGSACAWILALGRGRSFVERTAVGFVLCGVLLSGLPAARRALPLEDPLTRAIAAAVPSSPPGGLVLVEWRGPHGLGPHHLYAARRGAWAVHESALTAEALGRLNDLGARRIAVVSRERALRFLGPRPLVDAPVDDAGTRVRVWALPQRPGREP